jgi:hypothetical protein
MRTGSVRAWYRPKKILIVSDMSEHPARTLEVITKVQGTGARLFLVPLHKPTYGPHLPFDDKQAGKSPLDDTHQALLWAEILSEATVLKSARLLQVPELAESVKADIVILVASSGGFTQLNAGQFEIGLLGSLDIPILVFGRQMDLTSWNYNDFHSILMPITFGLGLAYQLRFACRLASHYRAHLTLLHVFEGRRPDECHWERTPVAVESKLPISDLKREGILCPMEIAVCEGYPEQAILRFNDRKHHDLIILGTSRSWTQREFRRSVVEGVTTQADCPIVVIGRTVGTTPAAIEAASRLTSA